MRHMTNLKQKLQQISRHTKKINKIKTKKTNKQENNLPTFQ